MSDLPEERIIDVLKQSPLSLTILQAAEKCSMHRVTAAKYLAVLEAKGMVSCRNAGKAKLYSIAEARSG